MTDTSRFIIDIERLSNPTELFDAIINEFDLHTRAIQIARIESANDMVALACVMQWTTLVTDYARGYTRRFTTAVFTVDELFQTIAQVRCYYANYLTEL